MRTTITLDPDVERLLNDACRRSGKTFKATVNDALRAGLKVRSKGAARAPSWLVADLGVPLVDLTKGGALADELDDARQVASAVPAGRRR